MESIRRQIDDEATMIGMIDERLATDQLELDAINNAEAIRAEEVCGHRGGEQCRCFRSLQAERIATDLQGKHDVLAENVAILEAEDAKTKERLAELRAILAEATASYLKDKTELEQIRAGLAEKHKAASVSAAHLRSKQVTTTSSILDHCQ